MSDAVSFQTRARAVDHLGRGQIADSPTAISELWKNAYDAYARSVALHVFDGEPIVGAIFDDGIGMDRSDIVERWLVIGTESKIEDQSSLSPETFGLPARERQGEKGIGRLSIAFLAPATILVSKKRDSRFVAVLIDWRLFENPFIALGDILLPVEELDTPGEIVPRLSSMIEVLRSNLGERTSPEGKPDPRLLRLRAGWERYGRVRANPTGLRARDRRSCSQHLECRYSGGTAPQRVARPCGAGKSRNGALHARRAPRIGRMDPTGGLCRRRGEAGQGAVERNPNCLHRPLCRAAPAFQLRSPYPSW